MRPQQGNGVDRSGASRPICTARIATSTTRIRRRALFSFNSPLGACETCRGFGRVIGIDYGLVIPDECKDAARGRDQALADPELPRVPGRPRRNTRKSAASRSTCRGASFPARIARWVLDGEPEWQSWDKSWPGVWYGVARFFAWLETKAYKMHIRVLLSKYRAYTPCAACGGARLKPDALLWRLGTHDDADRGARSGVALPPARRSLRRRRARAAARPHDSTISRCCRSSARARSSRG